MNQYALKRIQRDEIRLLYFFILFFVLLNLLLHVIVYTCLAFEYF